MSDFACPVPYRRHVSATTVITYRPAPPLPRMFILASSSLSFTVNVVASESGRGSSTDVETMQASGHLVDAVGSSTSWDSPFGLGFGASIYGRVLYRRRSPTPTAFTLLEGMKLST